MESLHNLNHPFKLINIICGHKHKLHTHTYGYIYIYNIMNKDIEMLKINYKNEMGYTSICIKKINTLK